MPFQTMKITIFEPLSKHDAECALDGVCHLLDEMGLTYSATVFLK